MKKKITLTEKDAENLYYSINHYYISIRMAEMIDKTAFSNLKFWSPSMNNHLRKARESMGQLMFEFNRCFRPKGDSVDVVEYDAPSALFEAMEYLSRLHPNEIEEKLKIIKNDK